MLCCYTSYVNLFILTLSHALLKLKLIRVKLECCNLEDILIFTKAQNLKFLYGWTTLGSKHILDNTIVYSLYWIFGCIFIRIMKWRMCLYFWHYWLLLFIIVVGNIHPPINSNIIVIHRIAIFILIVWSETCHWHQLLS